MLNRRTFIGSAMVLAARAASGQEPAVAGLKPFDELPVEVTRMEIGHAVPSKRPASEVFYFDRKGRKSPSLFPPNVGAMVPVVDAGMNVDGFEAHGGWIASAADLVRFASDFDRPEGPHC